MEILGVMALIVLVVAAASALGQVWGPLLFGVGFAGWGGLLLVSGYTSPIPEIGVAYVAGSVGEFAVAREFWRARDMPKGPSAGWRWVAVLVGIAGSVMVVGLLLIIAAAIAGYYSQL